MPKKGALTGMKGKGNFKSLKSLCPRAGKAASGGDKCTSSDEIPGDNTWKEMTKNSGEN
jgi:hypothetical protein